MQSNFCCGYTTFSTFQGLFIYKNEARSRLDNSSYQVCFKVNELQYLATTELSKFGTKYYAFSPVSAT